MDKTYRILVINPGSTSTKLSMFENETCLFTEDVFHDSSVLKQFPTINDQLDYRMEVVDKFLKDGNIDLTGVDAIVGRGGGCYSVEGGIYKIDDRLIQDTKAANPNSAFLFGVKPLPGPRALPSAAPSVRSQAF